jgi:thiamine-monophosphate kinase
VRRPNSDLPGGGGWGTADRAPDPDPGDATAIAAPVDGDQDEFALIGRLRARFEADGPLPGPDDLGIGDDAAAVSLPDPGPVILATDLVVEGIHVDTDVSTPEDIGWKSLMVAVSDLAAMGVGAPFALLSVAAPAGFPVERLGDGVAEAAASVGCRVVGGDLSGSPTLVVSVTAVGSLPDDGAPLLRRDGAGAGDHLFVTGPLGASAAGLRLLTGSGSEHAFGGEVPVATPPGVMSVLASAHRRPVARLSEGMVARRAGASAAIDVSDGLVADVVHLAEASGVGLELEFEERVVAIGATRTEALSGGEDYELVLATSDPDGLLAAFAAAGLRTPLAIGRCTQSVGQWTLEGGPLPEGGWRHLF